MMVCVVSHSTRSSSRGFKGIPQPLYVSPAFSISTSSTIHLLVSTPSPTCISHSLRVLVQDQPTIAIMAPSAEEILEIINARLPGGDSVLLREKREPGAVLSLCTEDFKFSVVGQEFDLAHSSTGLAAAKEYLAGHLTPSILGLIDESKPAKLKVVRVIGGGENPWAAVEFKSNATSLKGKTWNLARNELRSLTLSHWQAIHGPTSV